MRVGEGWMDRERDESLARGLGHREVALAVSQKRVRRLQVERKRIVDSGLHTSREEMLAERVAPFQAHRVDVSRRNAAGTRCEPPERKTIERGVVSLGDLRAAGVLRGQKGELGRKDRGLKLVETRVPALALCEVAAGPAVLAKLAQAAGQRRVVRRDRASVPIGAQILGGVEGEG